MDENTGSVTDAEGPENNRVIKVEGDFFTLEIEEHDVFMMGSDSEPSWIDLKFTLSDDDGDSVEFVAEESEIEQILKGINDALALKREREEEMSREDARVDAIEELIQDYEDRLACDDDASVMDRYAELYDMTYDELMAEREKMGAEAKADTRNE